MTFKARTQKKVENVIKQQSFLQTSRNSGLSVHRAHPATLQRSLQSPHSLISRDMLHLQSTVGNRAANRPLQRSNPNTNISSSGPVVQRVPSERTVTLPEKRTDDERRKCWSVASMRILANSKYKYFGGLEYGKMARKSKIGVYTMDKRHVSSVSFSPSTYFSPAALVVRPKARVKFVSINVPKNITHRIDAGVFVNGFPIRRFNICD